MNSIHADLDPGLRPWNAPVLAIAVSALLHGAIWSTWLTLKTEPEPEFKPPEVIEVSLIAAQPAAPQPQVQPPPEPPKPQPKQAKPVEKPAPKKPDKPKPKPTAKPAPRSEPAPEPAEESPAPMLQAPPAPVEAKPTAPAPAPFVEASYKSPSLHNPPTRYPRIALERQWEGAVTLRVQVLANGSAGEIKVERTSGHEILDQATIEQVRDWRFIPARKGDQAVVSWVIIPIEYKLKR